MQKATRWLKTWCLYSVLMVCVGVGSTSYGGVQFDGVDDYVDLSTSSVYQFANTTFSITGMFSSTSDDGYVFAKRGIGGQAGGYFLRVDAAGTLTARIVNTDNTVAAQRSTTSTSGKDGNWHCFGVVFTTNTTTLASNDISIYYDGVLDQGSRTDSGGTPYTASTQRLALAALSDLDASGWLIGQINDVKVWPIGLSAENMQRVCAAKVKYGGFTFGSVTSYWPLDNCGEGSSGDAVTFQDRQQGGSSGTGVDGANNTGLTCRGSVNMSYPPSAE